MFEVVLTLIVLHGLDGHDIAISLDEITSVHCKAPNAVGGEGLFTPGVNAMVNLSDGKFASVVETCQQIKDIIKAAQQQRREEGE